MENSNRRYIFIDFDNLKKIKFKKLEKVCDKVFVFIDSGTKSIPLKLVVQMQRLGKGIKWIPITKPHRGNMNYHIAFVMGQLDKKLDSEIEFAILSQDKSLDSLINYINEKGRNCIRVKREKTKMEEAVLGEEAPIGMTPGEVLAQIENNNFSQEEELLVSNSTSDTDVLEQVFNNSLIDRTARQTIKRLVRSGNRPVEINMLKEYILLNNQEMTEDGNIDKIINRLENTKEIQISDNEVIYNF